MALPVRTLGNGTSVMMRLTTGFGTKDEKHRDVILRLEEAKDDVLVGSARDWAKDGKSIRAGFHRLEIRHPGYYSFFQEVELPEGSHAAVSAQLRPIIE